MNTVDASYNGVAKKCVVAKLGEELFRILAIVIGLSSSQCVVSLDLDDIYRQIVSLRVDGTQIEYTARSPSLSRNGDQIAFVSADPWIVKDGNTLEDVYVRDRLLETSIVVSYGNEEAADRPSYEPSISLNGGHIAYTSLATNLVCPGCDANDRMDVYLTDLNTMSNLRISQGLKDETDGKSHQPSVSRDGNRVAFTSRASNLIANDSNGKSDVFVWDRYKGIKRVSLSTQGNQLSRDSHSPQISGNGLYVVFVAENGAGQSHILVRDLDNDTTLRVSEESDDTAIGHNKEPSICEYGDYIAWVSDGYLGRGATVPDRVFVRHMFDLTLCGVLSGCVGVNPVTWQLNDESGEQREPQIFSNTLNLLAYAVAPFVSVVYTSKSIDGRLDVVLEHDGPSNYDDYIVTVSTAEFGETTNGDSQRAAAWGDGIGWYIAFETNATNLIYDNNTVRDVVFAQNTD